MTSVHNAPAPKQVDAKHVGALMAALMAAIFAFQLNASMLSPVLTTMRVELNTTDAEIGPYANGVLHRLRRVLAVPSPTRRSQRAQEGAHRHARLHGDRLRHLCLRDQCDDVDDRPRDSGRSRTCGANDLAHAACRGHRQCAVREAHGYPDFGQWRHRRRGCVAWRLACRQFRLPFGVLGDVWRGRARRRAGLVVRP